MHVGLVIDIDSGITPGELSVAVLRLLTYFSQVSVCTLCQRRSCSTVLFCVLYARFSHVLSGNRPDYIRLRAVHLNSRLVNWWNTPRRYVCVLLGVRGNFTYRVRTPTSTLDGNGSHP